MIKIITGYYLANIVPGKGNMRKIKTDTSGHETQNKKTTETTTRSKGKSGRGKVGRKKEQGEQGRAALQGVSS